MNKKRKKYRKEKKQKKGKRRRRSGKTMSVVWAMSETFTHYAPIFTTLAHIFKLVPILCIRSGDSARLCGEYDT